MGRTKVQIAGPMPDPVANPAGLETWAANVLKGYQADCAPPTGLIYYVDFTAAGCSDDNDGLTPAYSSGIHGPWKTLVRAQRAIIESPVPLTIHLNGNVWNQLYGAVNFTYRALGFNINNQI